ncbi:protein IMPACT homolog [Saccostrea echinata]|uniref:protein IMPACT homolog n=1 Tax=Saccostrea echinata TaxID=191078 RepID=UPI002A824C14|nr:protein IMPACT homolog [Saccostrea echinata]
MASQNSKDENKSQCNPTLASGTTGASIQMSAIHDCLRSITGKLGNINILQQSVNNMNRDLWDEDGLDERIKYIGQQHEDNVGEFETLKLENSYLRKELQVLKSIVVNLDRRVTQQENEIVDLKGRSMKDNILVHNLAEDDQEDLTTRVSDLIKEHLNLEVGFIRIHRNGQKFPGNSKPRSITGKLQNYNDKELILQAIRQKRENGTINNMPFYITPQTPLQINESKKKLQEMNNKYREENVKTKIVGNKLVFPNGSVYRDKVLPPRAEDLLMLDKEEIEKLEECDVNRCDSVTEDGNIFTSLISEIHTYAQVRDVYKNVLRNADYACANHNILVYRFKDAQGRVHDGYCDNGEYGAGRRMLKVLVERDVLNVAVVISRKNGRHLGPRRFDVMNDLVIKAVSRTCY